MLSPTPEATILDVNDAFLKTSSRKRQDLIGTSVFDAFPANPDDPDDTGEADLRRSLSRVLATGKPDTMPAQRYPIRIESPTGEVRYDERYWSAMNTPVFGKDAQMRCIVHSTEDVTGRMRSDIARNESERRFRALLAATADVIYRMSADWTRMCLLDESGFPKDRSDRGHVWLEEAIPPDDRPLVCDAIRKAIRGKTILELEHRVFRTDGTIGWAHLKAVPMMDAQGDIYEWIGASSDITGRKRAEEALNLADRRKDEFLAMLAHELRNPLAPIGAAAELLQFARLDEARVRQTSEVIVRQVNHMTGLINDLLDVSRVTRGMVELDNAPLDIARVVTDAVEQVMPLIRSRRHHLRMELAPDTTMVLGDMKRLVQVVANLVGNAAKFTPDGGYIAVRTEVHEDRVVLEVVDNGIGMAPETVARVFDLFAQAERTSDRSMGGLGLGLALVKRLVELHQGSVCCTSQGIGEGSRFTVCLPRLAESAHSDRCHAAQKVLGRAKPLRILVVDDNVDAALMLAMLLESLGHEVLMEHGSRRALERARLEKPDVCILDIGLPDMDGNELAQRLRRQGGTSGAVLIAVTGYGQDKDREYALAAGFDHHLVKPIDTERLSTILAKTATLSVSDTMPSSLP
ncbi:MAG TPA: ATP-binding protein [Noviherbaspirillum sp.]|uniref:hybrid sensor histidine kinase/response regulator n=1 Tax=Noviherbaspirillum sp. TaxID=1926288 RepID=UPI002DDD4B61|nr:ATP-binding protein [Noviherbaspirillum sp.]HEV2611691.1 ATP-binding protein [Noviherbaspirillum sp.]